MSRSQPAGPPENLRVRRTRKLLREALVVLVEEKGFDALTVGELCERAMVSRAAFYRNYRDKYQLAEQIFDEAMESLLGTMADERPPPARWTGFFEHVGAYERFYRALLGRRGGSWFADRMRAALAEMVTEHFPRPRDRATGTLAPEVLAAVFVQSITWWLEQGRPVPAPVIADRSAAMAAAVIGVAREW